MAQIIDMPLTPEARTRAEYRQAQNKRVEFRRLRALYDNFNRSSDGDAA